MNTGIKQIAEDTNDVEIKQAILTGATGSGKTYLACAPGHNACRQGYKVYYYRLKALMDLCYQGHADGRYSKLLTKLNHSDLLLLDDWWLEPLPSEQRSDLLEIVDLMYQRGSIIVVSQTLKTPTGSFERATPRDRNGTFEPQLVKKHQTTLSDEIERKIIRMFALGMSYKDISQEIEDLYAFSVSSATISAVTDKVIPELKQ